MAIDKVPFEVEVARGRVNGYTTFRKFGYNDDIDAGAEEVWSAGGIRSLPGSEETIKVFSSGATDTSAGAGAQIIQVEYLESG